MLVKVFVESVRINLSNNTRVVIVKDSKIERYLLIWIGEMESLAIASELQGQKFERPLTHDLFANTLEKLGAQMRQVAITNIKDSTYFAVMTLEIDGRTVEIDARPSDAIALAVRTNAAVYVEEDVFTQAGITVANSSAEEDEK